MTIIPLHPDPDDPQDYSATDAELLPVAIFEDDYRGDSRGSWFWRVDHPALDASDCSVGPFPSARAAYENLMQYDKLQSSPAEMPDIPKDRVELAALDSTVGNAIARQLDSPHEEAREAAQRAFAESSYD